MYSNVLLYLYLSSVPVQVTLCVEIMHKCGNNTCVEILLVKINILVESKSIEM